MTLHLRATAQGDAAVAGRICYDAFKAIADRHGFPPDFPSPHVATELMHGLVARSDVYGVIAALEVRVVSVLF